MSKVKNRSLPVDKIIYITRDKNVVTRFSEFGIFVSEPVKNERGFYPITSDARGVSEEEFKKLFGFMLRPGECRKIRIRIEETP